MTLPITWPQRLGIVASNSYIVIVNAEGLLRSEKDILKGRTARTIGFVVCFHENKWVVVNVAVEMDVWSASSELQ